MLFFMVFLIFCQVTIVTNKNAGSTIFNSAQIKLGCWSVDDIAKLQARKEFEEIIPPPVNPTKVSCRYIRNILEFFKNALLVVEKDVDRSTAAILKESLSDTIGAHLNYEILPTVRFAYYAGYIPYRGAREAHYFFEQLKIDMNTQGVGWKAPPRVPKWSNLTVAKIAIGSGKLHDPCAHLIIRRDANNCIHLPIPKSDNEYKPSAIILPFKKLGLVSLTAPNSENILLKYFTTASRCILDTSPAICRHTDFLSFNDGLWYWMKRDVAPHLVDDKLYTAYGGVLRVAAAVQNYGKGLSRRNLFEYHEAVGEKWSPWRTFTKSYITVNTDWTPALYVSLVILTAIAICLLQVCYNYVFGECNACRCKSVPQGGLPTDIGYVKVDSSEFPPVMQQRSTGSEYFGDHKLTKQLSASKCSIGSRKTQQVYDLNENKEKVMEIKVISSEEDSDLGAMTPKATSDKCLQKTETRPLEGRLKSPPKIEATTAQLTLEKRSKNTRSEKKSSKPMYSTSTITNSYVFDQRLCQSDSWSISSSSTSGKSVTSTSTKSRTQRSRNSRDLAWARHVISRHSRLVAQSSGTELDGQSFTTPPSRR